MIMELQWRHKLLKERFDAVNRSISAIRPRNPDKTATNRKNSLEKLSIEQLKTLRRDLKRRISSQNYDKCENTAPNSPKNPPNPRISSYIRHLEQANKHLAATLAHFRAKEDVLLAASRRLTAATHSAQVTMAALRLQDWRDRPAEWYKWPYKE